MCSAETAPKSEQTPVAEPDDRIEEDQQEARTGYGWGV